MRKNKRKSVDSPIAAAWEKVFAEAAIDDIDALRAEGWMTVIEAAERQNTPVDIFRRVLERMHKAGKLDLKKIRVNTETGARIMNIYRPRV